jgi:hypothetical protein
LWQVLTRHFLRRLKTVALHGKTIEKDDQSERAKNLQLYDACGQSSILLAQSVALGFERSNLGLQLQSLKSEVRKR